MKRLQTLVLVVRGFVIMSLIPGIFLCHGIYLTLCFQTHLIGLDALAKSVDPSQLTQDLDGSLSYDHTIWIEMRCVSTFIKYN